MDGYDFEKLSREIVTSRLSGLAQKAPETAAEIARKILVSGVLSTRSRQDPRLTVKAICRGILGGMMLIHQDLPLTAALVLKEMGQASHDVPVSPEDLMTWAMEGFSEVAVIAGPECVAAIETAIEESFMGAGAVFNRLCGQARARGNPG